MKNRNKRFKRKFITGDLLRLKAGVVLWAEPKCLDYVGDSVVSDLDSLAVVLGTSENNVFVSTVCLSTGWIINFKGVSRVSD